MPGEGGKPEEIEGQEAHSMRIGIDAQFAAYELRGIGKYIVHLVNGLPRQDPGNFYVIYGPPEAFPALRGRANVKIRNPGPLPYPVWEQGLLPVWVRQDGLNLLHCPANTAPLLLPRQLKLMITIHDVMYLLPRSILTPSNVLRQRLGNLYRRAVVRWVAARADEIVTVSNFSKQQIVQYLGVDAKKVRVIHCGIDSLPRIPNLRAAPNCFGKRSLRNPFILALGSGDPRKNTIGVIQAYAGICGRLSQPVDLVILGLREWATSDAFRLVQEHGLHEAVYFADYVREEDLAWFYRHARCFVYPTLYEGFGFPVLEAMAYGTPLITSNVACLPEIAGDAALLVDPSSVRSIREGLQLLLETPGLSGSLIERGKTRVREFDWEVTVAETWEGYRDLLQSGKSRGVRIPWQLPS